MTCKKWMHADIQFYSFFWKQFSCVAYLSADIELVVIQTLVSEIPCLLIPGNN